MIGRSSGKSSAYACRAPVGRGCIGGQVDAVVNEPSLGRRDALPTLIVGHPLRDKDEALHRSGPQAVPEPKRAERTHMAYRRLAANQAAATAGRLTKTASLTCTSAGWTARIATQPPCERERACQDIPHATRSAHRRPKSPPLRSRWPASLALRRLATPLLRAVSAVTVGIVMIRHLHRPKPPDGWIVR